jgi:hypothetical protein
VGREESVQGQIAAVEEVLKKARAQFTGETWAASWEEWDRRWLAVKAKVAALKD